MVSLDAIFAVSRPILLYHNLIYLSITYTRFPKINLLIRDSEPPPGWARRNKVEVNHAPPAPVPSGARVVRHRRPRGLHPCGGRRRRAEGAEHPEAAGVAGAGGSSRRAGDSSLDVLTVDLSLDGLTDDLSLDVLTVDWMRSAGAICRPRGGGIYPLSQVLFSRFSVGF